MPSKKERAQNKADAIAALKARRDMEGTGMARKFLADVVSVSASGMSRHIAVYLPSMRTDTQPDGSKVTTVGVANVSWLVARALGWRVNRMENAVVVGGCGMDMRFHLLDCLAYVLDARAEWEASQTRGTFGSY